MADGVVGAGASCGTIPVREQRVVVGPRRGSLLWWRKSHQTGKDVQWPRKEDPDCSTELAAAGTRCVRSDVARRMLQTRTQKKHQNPENSVVSTAARVLGSA